ncbi:MULTISPECIES: hypothetical protein [unclassified Pseudomonas]|uniref:Phage tail protein n=1 Tax=Pseudomonas sp. MYb327 TaxID=2745230 RepID=A0AAU8DY63_9PSED
MSAKAGKLSVGEDERVVYEDGKPVKVILSGREVPLVPVKGRMHVDITVGGEFVETIESKSLDFIWSRKNPDVVGFFLDVTYEKGYLRISGDELETGKAYAISDALTEVNIRFKLEGIQTPESFNPVGTLTIREATENSIDGQMSFSFKGSVQDGGKETNFRCNAFSLNIAD